MKHIASIPLLSALTILLSCNGSVKEKINTVGDAAGETAGEFFKGVGKGIDNAMQVKIVSPPYIAQRGLEFSRTTIAGAGEGTDNLLNVYVIFKKDFKGKLNSKVYDAEGHEAGRASAEVEGKAGDAKYVDFEFDKRTNIDSDYKIVIE